MRTRQVIWLLVLFSFVAQLNIAVAMDDDYARKSLTGLRGVGIVVEGFDPEVERAGLTKATIQTDAELKLRLAGIRVLTHAEQMKEPGMPYLYINANVRPSGTMPWGTAMSISLVQYVRLDRNPTIVVQADTWGVASGGGYCPAPQLASVARNALKDQVDQFINAYLTVNPK